MLPLHLQCLLNNPLIDVVVDNAKSHISAQQGVKRRNSEPFCLSASGCGRRRARSRSLKRTKSDPPKPLSRWESCPVKKDVAPAFHPSSSSMKTTSLTCALNRPVRRRSIDDPHILAQLQDSLSSLEGIDDPTKNTAALLAKALETLDFQDDTIY